jgi:drug/metabolite transporter (DMT)-like permease
MYVVLALSTIFLSSNHVIGRGVHETIPPVGLSFWRWIFASCVLLPFVFNDLKQSLPLVRSNLKILSVVGITVVCTTTVILISLNFTTAINVSLINALQPVFTAMLAHLVLKDRLTLYGLSGIIMGLSGVIIMVTRADPQVLLQLQFNIGDLIAVLGIAGFAIYATTATRVPSSIHVATGLFVMVSVGALFILPFYILETLFYMPMPFTGQSILVVVTLSLLISVFAMLLWNRALMVIGTNRTIVFINLIPVSTTILAVIFLGESIHIYHLVGALLICSSIFLVTRK